jgi:hypothetical protein
VAMVAPFVNPLDQTQLVEFENSGNCIFLLVTPDKRILCKAEREGRSWDWFEEIPKLDKDLKQKLPREREYKKALEKFKDFLIDPMQFVTGNSFPVNNGKRGNVSKKKKQSKATKYSKAKTARGKKSAKKPKRTKKYQNRKKKHGKRSK